MRKSVLTRISLMAILQALPLLSQAQDVTQLHTGDNELVKGNYYQLPTQTADTQQGVNENQVYYLPDFFEKEGNGYKFLGESGMYALGIYKKGFGYDGKNCYLQIWPRDKEAQGNDDQYAHLNKNFGAIWVSGAGAGLPNYQNYANDPWNGWDTFAMTQVEKKLYQMTLTLGKELGPNGAVKFWFYNFSQQRYRNDQNRAEYGIPDETQSSGYEKWTKASHEFEFRGNQWKGDDFVPLLKMGNCDFMEVSKHTAEHDAQGGAAAEPQYGNGNMGGIYVGEYSDLPTLPSSTDKHTYRYKFTIDLRNVNDIKQDHKGETDFAYPITIENQGDAYTFNSNTQDITLDTEDNNSKHAISLRDAMRFQGGVEYAQHFEQQFNKMTITGYLNQSQDIAFLSKIAKNVKVLDLAGVTHIEDNRLPDNFAQNCTRLEEVILPASLQTLGANAFAGCTGLKIIRVKGNNAAKGAPASAFQGVNANQCELMFEDGADGNQYRNGNDGHANINNNGWMNILTKDIYENANRDDAYNYHVCHQANADVRLHRQFTGKWETIVLPFDVNKTQILAKEGHIDHASYFYSFDGNTIRFIRIDHTNTQDNEYDLTAGHPFLLRIKDNYTSPANDIHTFENVETKAEANITDPTTSCTVKNGLKFVGVYNATPKDRDKLNNIYALKNGQFYYATNASMKGYRAWFEKDNSVQAAKSFKMEEIDSDNTITAITGIDEDDTSPACFDIYNLSGQLVKKRATTTEGLPAGMYIINHKKVMVR